MSWRTRLYTFPLVRIVLAAAPIVAWTIAVAMAGPALHVPGVAMALLVGLGTVALYLAYVRLIERRHPAELAGPGAAAELLGGIALGGCLFAATMVALYAIGAATVEAGAGWTVVPPMLAAAVGAALSEEILVRAILFRLLENSLGTWIALAISAVLFGILHGFNHGATAFSCAAIALEAGVLLAAAFVVTRRLWLPFGLHLAWNFTEGGVFGASVSGGSQHGLFTSRFHGAPLVTGGEFGPEASIAAVAICLVAGIWLLVRAQRRGHVLAPFWRRAELTRHESRAASPGSSARPSP
jgi:membrane protease YdiL (CAAX protease family)